MKLLKIITALLLVTTVSLISCKTKSAKDLIVRKWKITDMAGKQTETMPDSIKAKIFADAVMEFKKDGKYETSGLAGGVVAGTYTVSADGKTFTTKNDGETRIDTLNILEISADKMVVQDKAEEMKISFKAK